MKKKTALTLMLLQASGRELKLFETSVALSLS
jgi:hypothetical protein